jgi:hypothetical protein
MTAAEWLLLGILATLVVGTVLDRVRPQLEHCEHCTQVGALESHLDELVNGAVRDLLGELGDIREAVEAIRDTRGGGR